MFEAGLLSLDWPTDDKERRQWELEGKQANSIRWPDGKSRTIQTLGPIGMVLLYGGHFVKAWHERQPDESDVDLASKALKGSLKSFTEQTFVRGMSLFSQWISGESDAFIKSYPASFVPNIVGKVARATDEQERKAVTVFDRILAKIPGARQTLEPRVDVLGREQKPKANPLEIMIDPTRPSKEQDTPVIKELRRLMDAGYPVTPSLLGGKKGYSTLTPEDNTNLLKTAGQLIDVVLQERIKQEDYINEPDVFKADEIKRLTRFAHDRIKTKVAIEKLMTLPKDQWAKTLVAMQEDGLISIKQLMDWSNENKDHFITSQDLIALEEQGIITSKKLEELGVKLKTPKPE